MKVYKMQFETPLRINPEVEGLFPRSDTIFAAVANIIAEVESIDVLKEFCESNPKFSSAFPFYKNNLFLPKPLKPPREIESNRELHKRWKKKRWIDGELIKNKKIIIKLEEKEDGSNEFIARTRIPKFYKEFEILRNTKHRINEQTQIFSVHTLSFSKNSGLFFLYSGDVNIDDYVKILGEEGIGGGKSTGYGKFKVKIERYSLNTSGKWNLLLSLCLPQRSEVEVLKDAYYILFERSGWTNSSRKKRMRVLAEGSIVPRIEGKMEVDCVNGVKIYRNYLALILPVGWWD